MTPTELRLACEDTIRRCGPDAYVQLKLARKTCPRNWDRVPLWRGGPVGRIVGELSRGVYMVDIQARAVIGGLEKLVGATVQEGEK